MQRVERAKGEGRREQSEGAAAVKESRGCEERQFTSAVVAMCCECEVRCSLSEVR